MLTALGVSKLNIFETFKARWIKEELDVHPAKDERAIVECFESFGVSPSEDLLALYSIVDGKDCMDGEHFRLWSLDEIREQNSSDKRIDSAKKFGVLFGDYCVDCWCYRINSKGEVLVDYFVKDREPKLRSKSLTEFFKLMEKSPDEALL